MSTVGRLTGKVAIITGAARGQGAAEAQLFVEEGARVVLTDVLEEQTAQSLDGIVEAFRINWVWMPPWGPEKITDDGREMMRALGFSI